MGKQLSRTGPNYDIRAHLELARAFPALAERLRPLLLTEIELECPHGHKLKVIAQLITEGRAVFCPECRVAFKPLLHPEVEVPEAFKLAPPQESAPPNARQSHDGNLAREGFARIAEGAGLLLRAAGGHLFGRRSPARRLLRRSGGWLTSGVLHAVLLFLAMFLGIRLDPPQVEDHQPLITDVKREAEQERYVEKDKPRDVFSRVHENIQELEVPLPEVPEAKPPDPLEDIPVEDPALLPGKPRPLMDISDIPLEALTYSRTGRSGVMGLGATARPGSYALRGDKGLRLKAARRGGGGPDTESAVARALAWLARNQEQAGYWGLNAKGSAANSSRGLFNGGGKNMRGAMTGFSVLAFLGAGYTHKGGHKYAVRVRKGLEWLIEAQAEDGSFVGRTRKCGYAQGVVTLALAEAVAMSGKGSGQSAGFDRRLRAAAQKGVDFITKSQNPYAGWDYSSRGGTSDTSITVWNCMALKSARTAGLKVDGSTFQGIQNWLNAAQNMSAGSGSGREWAGGGFGYRGRGKGRVRTRGRTVTVMHPAGLMMRLMTGTEPGRREAWGPANLLLTYIPEDDGRKVSKQQLEKLVDAFIKKHYLRWDSMTAEQQEVVRKRAEVDVPAYPRTVDEYIQQRYKARWSRMSEGQRAALREIARRAVAALPRTVEEYIDKNYRPWKTFDEQGRKRHRRYARHVVKKGIYGKAFPRSIYFLYHSTLAMFQMDGRHWKSWNPQMKKVLLDDQLRGGADDGSWKPPPGYGMCTSMGRTMSTALGAMTLEVYYRYLRIYDK
jgi:hypothetical protein